MKVFVPENAAIPSGLVTPNFKLRMLTIHDLVKDYDAVMTSVDHLKGVFGPDEIWPVGLTLEEDLIDLGWHQKEFELRNSFAFTVMNLGENKCLGCVYVDPAEKSGYDARIILWVRQSEAQHGLDDKLYSAVRRWLADKWWFTSVGFPGREITWSDWNALPSV